jgi:peptide/nickel transport system permease protein
MSIVALLIIILIGAGAPLIAPQDPRDVQLPNRLKPPGFVDDEGRIFYLGADPLGRDILSRLIYGARVSLVVGLSAVSISGFLGLSLGLLSGFYGGRLDDIIMRLADVQLAFPDILLYIAVLAVLGAGLDKVILVLGISGWVIFARVIRSEVLLIREQEFVMAARSIGSSDLPLILRHILPNVVPVFIVIASFAVANNIIAEASLSFLGLGVPPSIPTWGTMLAESREYLRDAWWPVTFPGLVIMLTVFSINILGDWLRDYLDPRSYK